MFLLRSSVFFVRFSLIVVIRFILIVVISFSLIVVVRFSVIYIVIDIIPPTIIIPISHNTIGSGFSITFKTILSDIFQLLAQLLILKLQILLLILYHH